MEKHYKQTALNKLPFLISIPHGGLAIPQEVRNAITISDEEIFEDIDPYTREIYNIEDSVEQVVEADIARTFVDLNRTPEQLPPQFPDGIIKSATCYNKIIYKPGMAPGKNLIEILINKYHSPYHSVLQNAMKNPLIKMGFDCHSMAAIGPPVSPDSGKERPLINLGNADGKTCSNKITELLKNCFKEIFNFAEDKIIINYPFKGGHITRRYGNNPKPWIQIEISRALYLSEPWFNKSTLKADLSRLKELNNNFKEVMTLFNKKISDEMML